jgi:hypothetical protein
MKKTPHEGRITPLTTASVTNFMVKEVTEG